MAKKVFLNGVEIYTSTELIASETLFDFVQKVIDLLESALATEDENFHLRLHFEFYPHHDPKHHIRLSIKNSSAQKKVIDVLRCSALDFTDNTSRDVQFDLIVQGE
jgi:hypothetical protein